LHISSGTLETTLSSGLESPSDRRHISFNDEVAQCIAIDAKEGEEGGDGDDTYNNCGIFEDDESSDDGVVMMKTLASRPPLSNLSSPRSSFSSDSKTIAPLPPTTLKYRRDTPEPEAKPGNQYSWWPLVPRLSQSPSTETLRPPKPKSHVNFLLNDEDYENNDYEVDLNWQPERNPTQANSSFDGPWFSSASGDILEDRGLYLSSSSMFIPLQYRDDNDDDDNDNDNDDSMNTGLFGKVVDTVNTARDIAHVIWNVGWRR
jgi:hypothetical protein